MYPFILRRKVSRLKPGINLFLEGKIYLSLNNKKKFQLLYFCKQDKKVQFLAENMRRLTDRRLDATPTTI